MGNATTTTLLDRVIRCNNDACPVNGKCRRHMERESGKAVQTFGANGDCSWMIESGSRFQPAR